MLERHLHPALPVERVRENDMANGEKTVVLIVEKRHRITDAFVRQLVNEKVGDVRIVRWSVQYDCAHYDLYEGWMVVKNEVHVVCTAKES